MGIDQGQRHTLKSILACCGPRQGHQSHQSHAQGLRNQASPRTGSALGVLSRPISGDRRKESKCDKKGERKTRTYMYIVLREKREKYDIQVRYDTVNN